ncbi:MAG TPA: hypothetical protein VHS34_10315 [Terriglobales bacterium]|nr:hypothetical protein [Terriglobales bacterium]
MRIVRIQQLATAFSVFYRTAWEPIRTNSRRKGLLKRINSLDSAVDQPQVSRKKAGKIILISFLKATGQVILGAVPITAGCG